MKKYVLTIFTSIIISFIAKGQTIINSLSELREVVEMSNQNIKLAPGNYHIEDLPSNDRYFDWTGSNNTIDLRGVYIEFPVDATRDQHFLITGSDNILRGGTFENTYEDGTTEITDYVAYNNDRNKFANGEDPHLVIQGDGNKVVGVKMTVRGSFPYGYGSIYGINNNNQFGLSKRGGIAVQGTNAVIDSCELQMRAFGHGIYIQSPSNHTIIKNTIVIGDLRLGSELLAETDPNSLPSRSNFMDFSVDHENPSPIDPTRGISLCEDGIRLYNNGGSMEVINCRVEKMRGGIRGYLGSGSTVVNSTALDCESTNFNLPSGGSITNSFGNFAYCPLSDYRLNRSNTDVELTIIPSPHASGSHNLLDLNGNNHDVIFHRSPGPEDTEEQRAIVVTGDNSTIINETEYTIILESGASKNTIISCGLVIDNGSNNTITLTEDCLEGGICLKRTAKTEAECFDDMFGVETEPGSEGTENVGFIDNGDWMLFENIDLSGIYSVNARVASKSLGGIIEFRLDALNGEKIGEVEVSNTGGWQDYETVSANVGAVSGNHNLYLVFKGGEGALFNIDWFGFSEEFLCEKTGPYIEAECFHDMSGIQTEDCSEGTLNVGFIDNGDWMLFENIDLTDINGFKARVASKSDGGDIEVRLDNENGEFLGVLPVGNTGGWQSWVSDSVRITEVEGTHDIVLLFVGGSGSLFNINNFEFYKDESIVTAVNDLQETSISIFPNPSSGLINFSERIHYQISSSIGQEIISGDGISVDLTNQPKGMYLLQVEGNIYKIIKE